MLVFVALAAQAACTRANPAYRPWLTKVGASQDGGDGLVSDAAPPPHAAEAPDAAANVAEDLPAPPDLAPDLLARPTGLVSRWRLDERAGEAAMDDLGANPGVLRHGVSRVTASFPQAQFANLGAASFDGEDDYVELSVATLPAMEAPKSVSLWCRPSGGTSFRRNLFVLNNHTARESLQLGLENGIPAVWSWGPSPAPLIGGEPLVERWYHLVYAYDGAAQRLYVDGKLVDSRTAPPPTAPAAAAYLGTYDAEDDRSELWSGLIDDVRVYDRGLTEAEIAWLAAGGD